MQQRAGDARVRASLIAGRSVMVPYQVGWMTLLCYESAAMTEHNEEQHAVFIVDDDWRVCEALEELLAARGFKATTFPCIACFLARPRTDVPACLVLDVELPDLSGLEFQQQLSQADATDDTTPPIVFITGHGDIASSVRAVKRGAIDYLTKPLDENSLIDAITNALDHDRERRHARAALSSLKARYDQLTPRERDVMPLVVSGLLNKQAAAQLQISEVTLQIHRGRIMQKMAASSFAELVRMAIALKLPIP